MMTTGTMSCGRMIPAQVLMRPMSFIRMNWETTSACAGIMKLASTTP